MPRNTFLFVVILAIVAAFIVGINIGRRLTTIENLTPVKTNQTEPIPSITSQSPTIESTKEPVMTYESQQCKITFDYPKNFIKLEGASGSAIFTNSDNPKDSIVLSCQKDLPRPPLQADQIEIFKIASLSAKLYHDTSVKDGTPIDKLIFTHPKTGLDVFLAGFGETFNSIIQTLRLSP